MSTIATGSGAAVGSLPEEYLSEIRQLHTIMGQSPVAMCLFVGHEMRVVAINELMLEIWGRSLEQSLDMPLMDVLPELRGQAFDASHMDAFPEFQGKDLGEVIRGVMSSERAFTATELPIDLMRDGRLQTSYYNFIYKPYYGSSGALIGVGDVTEIVMARRAVEEREARLQELNHQLEVKVEERTAQLERARAVAEYQHRELQRAFEQAPVAIFVVKGSEYLVELVNPKMCEVLDQREDEALGRPLFDVIPAAADQGFEDLLDEVMRTGKALGFSERPVRLLRQGVEDTAYFNFVYHPYLDKENKVVGVTAVAVEVTEHVIARRQLEASEQRFSLLLESLPQMTWTNLPDGTVNYFSQSWTDYTGSAMEEILGWGWERNVHPTDFPSLLAEYKASVAEGRPLSFEHRILSREGQYRWHLSRSLPLRDDKDNVFLFVGTSTDIHEVRDAEAELQRLSLELSDTNKELSTRNRELAQTNQELTRINADLDSFVYAASHDLKAPITNIKGLHALLQSELTPETNAETAPILDMMDASIARFMNAIADLSDVARIQKVEQEPADLISIGEKLDGVLADLSHEIKAADAKIEVDVSGCETVYFARRDLRSILSNLISNALKYRSPDRDLRVKVKSECDGEFVVISVIDNGLGMDLGPDHKLFSMFYRMHHHVDGSGVGLHIVKRILDARGGRVEVESAVDVGTTFRVYLPIPVL